MRSHGPLNMILRGASLLTLAVLAFLALQPTPAAAQSLSYTTVTRGEFGGSMGQMMQMIPGAQDASRESTFIKGTLRRADGDGTSTITDLAEGRFTYLQHDEESWYSFSMDEMVERREEAMAGAMAGAGMNPYQQYQADPASEPRFEIRFSTERTGRSESFDGYSADEVLMIVEMVPREEAIEEGEELGSTILFTQSWVSSDFPEYEALQEARAQMGQQFMAGGGGDMAASFQAAFAQDPKMQEAFERNAEEMKAMDGIAVKTVSSFVMVPHGMEFDREAVLAGLDQPLASGGENLLGQAAAAGARDAMKSLGGMLGRRRQQQPEPEEEATPRVQTIIMRMTSTIEDVRTDALSDEIFRPPANYREIDPGFGEG